MFIKQLKKKKEKEKRKKEKEKRKKPSIRKKKFNKLPDPTAVLTFYLAEV